MYYGTTNGWLEDENGTSYLKLTGGAQLILPDFKPFALDLTAYDIYG